MSPPPYCMGLALTKDRKDQNLCHLHFKTAGQPSENTTQAWSRAMVTEYFHIQAADFPDFRMMKLNAFYSSIPCPLNYVPLLTSSWMKVVLHCPSEMKSKIQQRYLTLSGTDISESIILTVIIQNLWTCLHPDCLLPVGSPFTLASRSNSKAEHLTF